MSTKFSTDVHEVDYWPASSLWRTPLSSLIRHEQIQGRDWRSFRLQLVPKRALASLDKSWLNLTTIEKECPGDAEEAGSSLEPKRVF